MQGAGPSDQEFIQIQSIYVMWKESYREIEWVKRSRFVWWEEEMVV